MRKMLTVLALLANTLTGETVYMSQHGKTYHKAASCMALSRVEHPLQADRAEAEAHALKACGICYRKPSTKAKVAPKTGNGAWAK